MGHTLGGVLVLATILIFVAIFLSILYLFTKNKAGFNINFVSGNGPEAAPTLPSAAPLQDNELLGFSAAPAAPADPVAQRATFLKTLDSFEKVIAIIYIGLLFVVLAAATAAMAWIYFRYPNDGFRDFMLLIGGIVYLIAVAGISMQIYVTRRRLEPRPIGPTLVDQLGSQIQFHVQTTPEVGFVDAAALERAHRHVAAGGTVEEACALVDPRYQQMAGWKKDLFRKAVEMSLEKQA